jgi:chromosome segregation ATPase
MEERLIRVEEKLASVSEDLSDIKSALKDIASSLKTLAVLEEKHNNVAEALKRAFRQIERNEGRIDKLESAMPNVVLASGWVFKAVLAVMALLGAVAIGVVMRGQ